MNTIKDIPESAGGPAIQAEHTATVHIVLRVHQ